MPTRAPPPAAAPPPPAPAPAPAAGGGMMGGLMGSVVSGMATGAGMGMGQRAIDSVMGPRQVEHVHSDGGAGAPAAAPVKCSFEMDTLNQCLQQREAAYCQQQMEMLQ